MTGPGGAGTLSIPTDHLALSPQALKARSQDQRFAQFGQTNQAMQGAWLSVIGGTQNSARAEHGAQPLAGQSANTNFLAASQQSGADEEISGEDRQKFVDVVAQVTSIAKTVAKSRVPGLDKVSGVLDLISSAGNAGKAGNLRQFTAALLSAGAAAAELAFSAAKGRLSKVAPLLNIGAGIANNMESEGQALQALRENRFKAALLWEAKAECDGLQSLIGVIQLRAAGTVAIPMALEAGVKAVSAVSGYLAEKATELEGPGSTGSGQQQTPEDRRPNPGIVTDVTSTPRPSKPIAPVIPAQPVSTIGPRRAR